MDNFTGQVHDKVPLQTPNTNFGQSGGHYPVEREQAQTNCNQTRHRGQQIYQQSSPSRRAEMLPGQTRGSLRVMKGTVFYFGRMEISQSSFLWPLRPLLRSTLDQMYRE